MKKEKILLVEDEEDIRKLIQLYLESKAYEVIPAASGNLALELASMEKPNLILLDIEMPGIDGFEVCKRIREINNTPIIFISSYRNIKNKLKCFELGGDDYVTKPFD